MFEVTEVADGALKAKVLATVATLEAGKAFLAERFDIVHGEDDTAEGGYDCLARIKGNRVMWPVQFAINPIR